MISAVDYQLINVVRMLLVRSLGLPFGDDNSWAVHGIGMMRTYTPDGLRVSVWDHGFQTAKNSATHDHPWDFRSGVIAGRIINSRYEIVSGLQFRDDDKLMAFREINTSEPVPAQSAGRPCVLRLIATDMHEPHADPVYGQGCDEIHSTEFHDGTVTVVRRTIRPERSGVARIFWPRGEDFSDATPRPVERGEFESAIKRALHMLGKAL